VDWWFENNRCPANWSASYDNDAQIVGDHVDFSFRSVGDACGCAKRHFERSLLDYGPGKRVQTGTARTMACAEVSIPTRDGAACAYSQIQNRATAERYRPRVCLRATDGTDFSEFAVTAGLSSGRRRDISRSRDTLHSPSWRLWTGRSQSRQLHGLLPIAGSNSCPRRQDERLDKVKTLKAPTGGEAAPCLLLTQSRHGAQGLAIR
jgi:hypothetical protein